MTMKKKIINFIYWLLDFLPENLSEKIKLCGCVLSGDWHFVPPRYPAFPKEYFADVTDEKIIETYTGFPKEEIDKVCSYVSRTRQYAEIPYPPFSLIYKHDRIRGEANSEYCRIYHEISNEARQLSLEINGKKVLSPEVLYYHHGLRFSDSCTKEYIKNKIFIDAGAGIGDSALIFQKYYSPLKVCSFEPSQINRENYLMLMKKNKIMPDRYHLYPIGLGEKDSCSNFVDTGSPGVSLCLPPDAGNGNLSNIQIKSLDELFPAGSQKIGMIKADVEGMCLPFVKGSIQCIRRDLPVLSLCIYHNQEEILGVYSYLKSWDLPYEYHLQYLTPKAESIELVLLAYPKYDRICRK